MISQKKAKLAMTWMQGFLTLGPQKKAVIKEHFPFPDQYLEIALGVAWGGKGDGWELQDQYKREIFD